MYSSRTRVSFSPSSSAFGNRVKPCCGASTASVKAKTLRRAVYVEGTITSISRYAAWIITAPSAISRLDLGAFSEPAATTAPRARTSAAATAAVERADEARLDARLALPIVIANVESCVGSYAGYLSLVVFRAPCVERTRRKCLFVRETQTKFLHWSRTSVARLDPIADAHSPAAPVAAVVAFPLLVATPGVLSFDVLLEDARFFLAVVICVWRNR